MTHNQRKKIYDDMAYGVAKWSKSLIKSDGQLEPVNDTGWIVSQLDYTQDPPKYTELGKIEVEGSIHSVHEDPFNKSHWIIMASSGIYDASVIDGQVVTIKRV